MEFGVHKARKYNAKTDKGAKGKIPTFKSPPLGGFVVVMAVIHKPAGNSVLEPYKTICFVFAVFFRL